MSCHLRKKTAIHIVINESSVGSLAMECSERVSKTQPTIQKSQYLNITSKVALKKSNFRISLREWLRNMTSKMANITSKTVTFLAIHQNWQKKRHAYIQYGHYSRLKNTFPIRLLQRAKPVTTAVKLYMSVNAKKKRRQREQRITSNGTQA